MNNAQTKYGQDVNAAYAARDKASRKLNIWTWAVGIAYVALFATAFSQTEGQGIAQLVVFVAFFAGMSWLFKQADVTQKQITDQLNRALDRAGK